MGSATVQGELWGRPPRQWAEIQEPMHTPVWEAMLNSAKVAKGLAFSMPVVAEEGRLSWLQNAALWSADWMPPIL